ncbi:DUF1820 family protein [Coxiella endosymbiont of Amblyomma americanum]|uniref:DUF1820 family protein n=1 Tax=Coxiella endosymbiont of Amblyomma americanum TaxID=325775 RepID=UPI00057C9E7D|nr:DUF1820 family protein [Coxiella endosymbiont of Amblyomma americanum]AUJ58938.1 hypothetical protein B1F76_02640 [Coxiella-like endosymbiont of Amblyomma americanum]
MEERQRIYRVIFNQDEKVYEMYAKYISEESLMGFIEMEKLIFNDAASVVVDPSEEKLKTEFQGVKRTYIPMHMILRIDEMEKQGFAKIKGAVERGNVHHFPGILNRPIKE